MPEDVLNGLYHHDFSKTKDMAFVHSIGGSNVGKDWRRTGYSGLGTAVKALGLSSGPGLEFDFVVRMRNYYEVDWAYVGRLPL